MTLSSSSHEHYSYSEIEIDRQPQSPNHQPRHKGDPKKQPNHALPKHQKSTRNRCISRYDITENLYNLYEIKFYLDQQSSREEVKSVEFSQIGVTSSSIYHPKSACLDPPLLRHYRSVIRLTPSCWPGKWRPFWKSCHTPPLPTSLTRCSGLHLVSFQRGIRVQSAVDRPEVAMNWWCWRTENVGKTHVTWYDIFSKKKSDITFWKLHVWQNSAKNILIQILTLWSIVYALLTEPVP